MWISFFKIDCLWLWNSFYLISLWPQPPPPPFDSVSMMKGECFYCTLDVSCTIFMCVCFVLTSVMGWVCTPPSPTSCLIFRGDQSEFLQPRSINSSRLISHSRWSPAMCPIDSASRISGNHRGIDLLREGEELVEVASFCNRGRRRIGQAAFSDWVAECINANMFFFFNYFFSCCLCTSMKPCVSY